LTPKDIWLDRKLTQTRRAGRARLRRETRRGKRSDRAAQKDRTGRTAPRPVLTCCHLFAAARRETDGRNVFSLSGFLTLCPPPHSVETLSGASTPICREKVRRRITDTRTRTGKPKCACLWLLSSSLCQPKYPY